MMSINNTDSGCKMLYGSLTRLASKLEARADIEMVKLDNLINSANNNSEIPKERISTLKNLKEDLDHVLSYVKTNAIDNIVYAYKKIKNGNDGAEVLLNEEQIIFFIQRQRDRGDNFAKEIASFLAKSFNTFAPLDVLRRERTDFALIDFGNMKMKLSEEVTAIDSAFSQGNMSAFDDLIKCITVSKKATTKWYEDPCYFAITDAMTKYDFGAFCYLYPKTEKSQVLTQIKSASVSVEASIAEMKRILSTEISQNYSKLLEQLQELPDITESSPEFVKLYKLYPTVINKHLESTDYTPELEMLQAQLASLKKEEQEEVPVSSARKLTIENKVPKPPRFIGEKGERAFKLLYNRLDNNYIEGTTYENFAGLFRCLPQELVPQSFSKIKWISRKGERGLQYFIEALYRPADDELASLDKAGLSKLFYTESKETLNLGLKSLYCWGKNKSIDAEHPQEHEIQSFLKIITEVLKEA